MRTVFEILPASFEPENCTLLCESCDEGFSFCIKDEVANSFLGLGVYHYDKSKPPIGLPIALQIIFHQKEILSKRFKKVKIVYSFPQSVLIPFPLYDSEKNSTILNIMHGDLHEDETLMTDIITSQSLYNCYRISSSLREVLQNQFSGVAGTHQYSLLLNEPAEEKDRMNIIFYTRKIVVSVWKDGKCQLVNSFQYHTPEDVSYILLNICHQLEIENIRLEMSGLIEKNSALYNEVYKFFTEVELTPLQGGITYAEEITKFPSHYFSNIFAIDSCE
ncbi:MAG: DUF3822 family protein [Ginsengibacter sp.]